MNTILLLDLENTIIYDWMEDRRLMCARFPILKQWVMSHLGPNTRVGLFSYAVYDQADLKVFDENGGMRMDIELTHKFKFDEDMLYTVDELLLKARAWFNKPFMDRSNFFDFMTKPVMVQEIWLREFNQPNTKVILFDDTVPNVTLFNDDVENNSLQMVDPWTIITRDYV